MAGKGDSPKNCFSESFRENYEVIFGKKSLSELGKIKTSWADSPIHKELKENSLADSWAEIDESKNEQ